MHFGIVLRRWSWARWREEVRTLTGLALALLFTGFTGISHAADRAAILKAMQEVMGPLPGREKACALDLKIEEEADCGSYIRRLISYQSEPGSRVAAYLLIPKAALERKVKAPGVLCLHQTHRAGQKVVVGLGESPNDEYGVELARRGYVCLAPPYPHLANYAPPLKELGYSSGTMKAIWDNMRALDLLDSLPFVRHGSYGCIGHSLGGHNGLFTAAFDARIKVVVTSCGFDLFRDYMDGRIEGWAQERYMPAMLHYKDGKYPFDFDDVLSAIAPRTIFISAPLGDSNFKWKSVDNAVAAARPAFGRAAATALIVEHPDTGHVFPPEMREKAYEVMDRVLHHK
jgi:hypothetical protein